MVCPSYFSEISSNALQSWQQDTASTSCCLPSKRDMKDKNTPKWTNNILKSSFGKQAALPRYMN